MKKFLLFIFIFFIIQICANASTPKLAPLLPYQPYNPFNSGSMIQEDASSDYPKINFAEKKLFGHTFSKEDITHRLSRLEKRLFKADYPYMSLSERTDNISSQVGLDKYAGISQNELAKMEQRIFMKIYPKDDKEMRITRLEKEIFGAMQAGDLNERYDTLKSATKYYNAFPPQLSNQIPYYSNPYHEAWQAPKMNLPTIIKNIGSFFTPQMTGYSPNIVYPNNMPYNNYDPFFNNLPGMQRSISGPGYDFHRFKHYGQGSSVNILKD